MLAKVGIRVSLLACSLKVAGSSSAPATNHERLAPDRGTSSDFESTADFLIEPSEGCIEREAGIAHS